MARTMVNVPDIRRCMMHKNVALLSIGAALLLPLFFVDPGHAFQIENRQAASILMAGEMKGTANSPTTQVSNTPIPCAGRTGATCRTQSRQGSGATATAGSLYTSQVSNKPNPCTDAARGRTGAPCKRHSPSGSVVKVTDGSLYTDATMLP